MTDASNTTDRPTITPAEALEELFGPMAPEPVPALPVRTPGRAQKIAAIHACADYTQPLTDFEERVGVEPLPVRTPGRAQKIAAIHALAEWFTAHPDVPMPTSIVATYYVGPEDEPDDDVRHRDYRAVREVLDGRSYPIDNVGKLDRNFQFNHYPPMSTDDMRIDYTVAYFPRRGGAW